MKLAVGYPIKYEDGEQFADVVRNYGEHIGEVYFAWLDMPSGRSAMTARGGLADRNGQRDLEDDLRRIKQNGVKLNLLLNANCYGRDSLSRHLGDRIRALVAHLLETTGLDAVTTASLMMAGILKEEFPALDIRASVNMRTGSVKAMEYVADIMDSFYIQREYNRDLDKIVEMKQWADRHGKGLYMLANSGCLNFCAGQVFHDNLVAHEAEISSMDNLHGRNPVLCWNYYREKANWVAFLQNSWVRPEDLHRYEDYFPMVKLATRMHDHPARVIRAYSRRQFDGNLMELLEPGHAPLFEGFLIANGRFPADWFDKTTACGKRCHCCNYCAEVLNQVLERKEG